MIGQVLASGISGQKLLPERTVENKKEDRGEEGKGESF